MKSSKVRCLNEKTWSILRKWQEWWRVTEHFPLDSRHLIGGPQNETPSTVTRGGEFTFRSGKTRAYSHLRSVHYINWVSGILTLFRPGKSVTITDNFTVQSYRFGPNIVNENCLDKQFVTIPCFGLSVIVVSPNINGNSQPPVVTTIISRWRAGRGEVRVNEHCVGDWELLVDIV